MKTIKNIICLLFCTFISIIKTDDLKPEFVRKCTKTQECADFIRFPFDDNQQGYEKAISLIISTPAKELIDSVKKQQPIVENVSTNPETEDVQILLQNKKSLFSSAKYTVDVPLLEKNPKRTIYLIAVSMINQLNSHFSKTKKTKETITYIRKCFPNDNLPQCVNFIQFTKPYNGTNSLDDFGQDLRSINTEKLLEKLNKEQVPVIQKVTDKEDLKKSKFFYSPNNDVDTGILSVHIPIDFKNKPKTRRAIRTTGSELTLTNMEIYKILLRFNILIEQYLQETSPKKKERLKQALFNHDFFTSNHPVIKAINEASRPFLQEFKTNFEQTIQDKYRPGFLISDYQKELQAASAFIQAEKEKELQEDKEEEEAEKQKKSL